MKKFLFYLPVVTPWWFDHLVIHLIRSLSTQGEVHIVVPPLWRGTGVGREQLLNALLMPDLRWHIVDDADHPSLRTSPADPDALAAFVGSIDPDYVFCRSADIVTPARFPGKLRYLMESGFPPLPAHGIILQSNFWDHGAMPGVDDDDRAAIGDAFADTWRRIRANLDRAGPLSIAREPALADMGLPPDRSILAVPLEYEHEESCFAPHNRFASNVDMIRHLAERIDDRFLLAFTLHPLSHRYSDNAGDVAAIAALGDRARLVPNPERRSIATSLLIKHCDGLIVQNSKAIYAAAFFDKPILRLSHRPGAPWLATHADLGAFQASVAAGVSGRSAERTMQWFGYHAMHEIVDPLTVSGAEIVDRIETGFSRHRLIDGLAGFEARYPALVAA